MRFPTDLEPEFDWCTWILSGVTAVFVVGLAVLIVGVAFGWW